MTYALFAVAGITAVSVLVDSIRQAIHFLSDEPHLLQLADHVDDLLAGRIERLAA
jgi:hypothetical protein